jgi:hypothetical protein
VIVPRYAYSLTHRTENARCFSPSL